MLILPSCLLGGRHVDGRRPPTQAPRSGDVLRGVRKLDARRPDGVFRSRWRACAPPPTDDLAAPFVGEDLAKRKAPRLAQYRAQVQGEVKSGEGAPISVT